MSYNKTCAFCGTNSYKYELCSECYNLAKEEIIIKKENGKWIKNVRKGNEYKFYDENKKYFLKENLLNEYEMKFFNIVRETLKSKYVIVPQVNLQTIIETDSNKRNDELFRNVDFIIYYEKEYKPLLAIELNGKQHKTNEYWKERDKSVQQILNSVGLPLLTIDIKVLKKLTDDELCKNAKEINKYLERFFFLKKHPNDNKKLNWEKEINKLNIINFKNYIN